MLSVCHPKILHKHCLQFLLGGQMAPREIENNGYANKEHYGKSRYFLEWSLLHPFWPKPQNLCYVPQKECHQDICSVVRWENNHPLSLSCIAVTQKELIKNRTLWHCSNHRLEIGARREIVTLIKCYANCQNIDNKTPQTFRGTSSQADGFIEFVYLKLSPKNLTETNVEPCHELNLLGLIRRMKSSTFGLGLTVMHINEVKMFMTTSHRRVWTFWRH